MGRTDGRQPSKTLFIFASNLFRQAICINSSESRACSISAWGNILLANMILIQDIFSLLCGIIVPLMTIYFLTKRPATQKEPVENDERAVLANRTITNGQRRWASENISHSIQPSRNFPTEHDERYDWVMTLLATDLETFRNLNWWCNIAIF